MTSNSLDQIFRHAGLLLAVIVVDVVRAVSMIATDLARVVPRLATITCLDFASFAEAEASAAAPSTAEEPSPKPSPNTSLTVNTSLPVETGSAANNMFLSPATTNCSTDKSLLGLSFTHTAELPTPEVDGGDAEESGGEDGEVAAAAAKAEQATEPVDGAEPPPETTLCT